jgi:hypothetical protein
MFFNAPGRWNSKFPYKQAILCQARFDIFAGYFFVFLAAVVFLAQQIIRRLFAYSLFPGRAAVCAYTRSRSLMAKCPPQAEGTGAAATPLCRKASARGPANQRFRDIRFRAIITRRT